MLRRHPTSITITHDDIQAYDVRRAERLARLNRATTSSSSDSKKQNQSHNDPQREAKKNKTIKDPSDELKPLPGDRGSRIRAPGTANREAERLGRIAGRNLGSS
ncbi:hypothetical protein MMC14_006688 [Varicellaria rhodocarpa]|nr:hypothetical protein [Varicellaria rhodocarpa]